MTDTCIRRAWLTLGALSLDLEDASAGYFCTSFDLGAPTVREVTSSFPDADGVIDRTKYMGARAVAITVSALKGAGAVIDAVASSFAPFMVPSARPTLHWILDRPGTPERTLVVRAHAYDYVVTGDSQRDMNLQFVAADPVARAPASQTVTAWAGASGASGRTYNLTFNRTYPGGGGSPASGIVISHGDVPVAPYVRIYGPIAGAVVTFVTTGPPALTYRLALLSSYRIDAGHFVGIDCKLHTAWLDDDHSQSVLSQIDWSAQAWPVLPVAPDQSVMSLAGTSTTGISQAQCTWQDGFLS